MVGLAIAGALVKTDNQHLPENPTQQEKGSHTTNESTGEEKQVLARDLYKWAMMPELMTTAFHLSGNSTQQKRSSVTAVKLVSEGEQA